MSGFYQPSWSASRKGRRLPPQELLDHLCGRRFVLDFPEEDQQSFERIRMMFLVEQAHWCYEDNYVDNNPSLKSFTLKEFASLLCNSCEVLKPYASHIDDIFKEFTSYKRRVPVAGAIILDETCERCLLVKGWKGSRWSFPRGKKNRDEEDHACAIREVLEETGFDMSKLLKKEVYIEMTLGQQRVRLYIITGVKSDTVFAPLTKKEISEIAWHRLDELQPGKCDVASRTCRGLNLFGVAPFLMSLKAWISAHRPPVTPKPARCLIGSSVWRARGRSRTFFEGGFKHKEY
ncbi:unnamed protein product, partial [Cuscuta epithymum]